MKNKLNSLLSIGASAVIALSMVTSAQAALIAIVDSGTDTGHPEIANKIWNNAGEIDNGVDNDDDGFVGDVHGWNFVDGNNQLFDKHLVGTFSPDVYKYFELQTKYLNGQASADEITWLKAHVKDDDFVAQLEAFGNFVHGTHVAGISAKDADQASLMILKAIGTPTAPGQAFLGGVNSVSASDDNSGGGIVGGIEEKVIYAGLDYLAAAQGTGLAPEGSYLAMKQPRVANCSFGASSAAIKPLIKKLVEGLTHTTLTDDQLNTYVVYFLNKTVNAMQASFIAPSVNTLFVIAAGNDGTDNDVLPAAPANIKQENTIAVAATNGRAKLASFSNFGATMVDIAAPGVGIRSTVPGGGYVELSGTSQATPYIVNLAGRVMDANPALTIGQVKEILMETVDHKDFLAGKVRSGGIANGDRAITAGKYSMSMDLSAAIEKAKASVGDVISIYSENKVDEKLLFVPAMRSLF